MVIQDRAQVTPQWLMQTLRDNGILMQGKVTQVALD